MGFQQESAPWVYTVVQNVQHDGFINIPFQRDTSVAKSIFLILDPISRHNSKTPHVFRIPDFDLKPAQILENVPSPVLAKLPTRIYQIANRY